MRLFRQNILFCRKQRIKFILQQLNQPFVFGDCCILKSTTPIKCISITNSFSIAYSIFLHKTICQATTDFFRSIPSSQTFISTRFIHCRSIRSCIYKFRTSRLSVNDMIIRKSYLFCFVLTTLCRNQDRTVHPFVSVQCHSRGIFQDGNGFYFFRTHQAHVSFQTVNQHKRCTT